MQRRVWLTTLKQGKEEAYRRAHENVWPELIATAKRFGLKNHTVFLSGRQVIAYIESEDFDTSWQQLVDTDVKKRWNELMGDLFEDAEGPLFEDVFHFN